MLIIRAKSIVILLVLLSLFSCSSPDDVVVIREMVSKGALLAEKKNLGALLDLANDGFVAMPGELDKQTTKAVLWRAFRYYRDFHILYPQPVVMIEEDNTAFVSLPFLVVRQGKVIKGLKELYQEPKKWLREVGKKADLYNLDLELIKQGSSWKVRRATLGRVI